MADVKVSEVTGTVLDWMVIMARDGASVTLDEDQWVVHNGIADMPLDAYTPSTDWSQGGPIIERERITLNYDNIDGTGPSRAYYLRTLFDKDVDGWQQIGPTPLIAAMRCYVASKLGDIVSVPDDLKGEPNHG